MHRQQRQQYFAQRSKKKEKRAPLPLIGVRSGAASSSLVESLLKEADSAHEDPAVAEEHPAVAEKKKSEPKRDKKIIARNTKEWEEI